MTDGVLGQFGEGDLVVKIGSTLLVDDEGAIRRDWLVSLAEDVRVLRGHGRNVVLVTSGAIAVGRRLITLPRRTLRLEEKQASAAVGQIRLAHAYQESLATVGLATAQVLLTIGDTEDRRRYINARATISTLLRLGAVPVVNENDTVATNEIRFGDNDRLSARVAVMISAGGLVLLSDVDGLYDKDPGRNSDAVHMPRVDAITPEIRAMAGGAGSIVGTGGMVSKLAAATIATSAGCRVLLTRGDELHPLRRLAGGGRHTVFRAHATPRGARKAWIGGSLASAGEIRIDDGAARALRGGSSLLPAGVVEVEGDFERGDAVIVRGLDGQGVAKGLSAYDAIDARRICGCRTEDIEAVLGYRRRDELIHRDDLVLL